MTLNPYFDRNPTSQGNTYSAGGYAQLGPHTATQRWSYTVPSFFRAMVNALVCQVFRDAAAGAAGIAESYVQYTPAGASVLMLNSAFNLSNTIGSGMSSVIGTSQLLV